MIYEWGYSGGFFMVVFFIGFVCDVLEYVVFEIFSLKIIMG